jgi:3-polyprenyl-4-hydroxybenzoate decarboxylase
MNDIDTAIASGKLSDADAVLIIETVLDTLIEVGNGVTDEDLHKQVEYLLAFRDIWMSPKIEKINK